jgi:hypothetical protein
VRIQIGALAVLLAGCGSPSDPSGYTEFVVEVEGERFVLRALDPETVRLATQNMQGGNGMFPIGPLLRGDGGFNAPWSWHLDPEEVRLTEVAVEVCDGRPSYVEAHLDDYPTYCPWGARVVAVRD